MNFYSLFLLVTFIPDILNIDNLLIKNLFWVVKIAFAAWVIFKEKETAFYFTPLQKLYLVVCLIYILNIFVDVYLTPNRVALGDTNGKMDLLGFFLDLLLALSFRYDGTFDSDKSFNFFWITLIIGLLLALHFARLTPRLLLFDEDTTRYDANSTVNTIIYGQCGCALCLASVYGLLRTKKMALQFLFILSLLLGFLSIAKAGSRSPVVVFSLVMVFYFLARLGTLKGLLIISSGLILVFLLRFQIVDFFHSIGSNIGDRLTNMVVEHDTSGRAEIWTNVFGIIERSPIFGAYYIVPSGLGMGMYPHNFYLEVFMATGIIGGIPFMVLIFITLSRTYKLLKIQHQAGWILLLYLQTIVFGFFSSGLYTSQELWILMLFILTINIPRQETFQKNTLNYSI